ncbi:MAG: hypothetical protein ABIH34_05195, partial [Nanoarchaeota archaeon]
KMNFLLVIIVVFLMATSFLGFFGSQANQHQYGESMFEIRNDGLYTEINGYDTRFDVYPSTVEKLHVDAQALSIIENSPILWITFPPKASDLSAVDLARFDLTNFFQQAYGKAVLSGITEESDIYTLPVKVCDDALTSEPVIMIQESNETGIFMEAGCILLKGNGTTVVMAKDLLIYHISGIIDG